MKTFPLPSVALGYAAGFLLALVAVDARAEFTNIHLFTSPNDGTFVYAAPVADASGTKLIGVTYTGVQGSAEEDRNRGIIYSINTDGTSYSILRKFEGNDAAVGRTDGSYPLYGHLTLTGNTIYSTTATGGKGVGTIYKINTDGTGYAVLHSIDGNGLDGGFTPYNVTLAVDAANSVLYGTTGNSSSGPFFPDQAGTVFKMNTDGSGYTVLHAFPNSTGTDGKTPYGSVVLSGTTLLGTMSRGGANNNGVIYSVNTDGSGFSVLHNFGANNTGDGGIPLGSLTLAGSKVYGMTQTGGAVINGAASGTVFSMNTDGTGYGILHTFTGGTDGTTPDYGQDLTLVGSTLYGATRTGGTPGPGTIFKINTDGSGYSTLFNFNGVQGSVPSSSPIYLNGKFYGTTPGNADGGNNAMPGTLYMFDPSSFTHTDNFANAASFRGFNTSFTGGLNSVLQLLDGTAITPTAITASLVTPSVPAALASDVINLFGTGTNNAFVMQLNYNPTLANSLYGMGNNPFLGWLDPNDNTWKNAVLGNTGGTPTFVNGAYNPATDFQLGKYGIDSLSHEVWAVVNHNSEFAVFGPAPAPEPSRVLLLLMGGCGLMFRRRR